GIDVLSPRNDHVLFPIQDPYTTVSITLCNVATMEPPTTPSLSCALRVIPIFHTHCRSSVDNFSSLSVRHVLHILFHNTYVCTTYWTSFLPSFTLCFLTPQLDSNPLSFGPSITSQQAYTRN